MARATREDEKLYKIGEVCKLADVQPYVLRYWETEFPQLAPNKSGGGQRLYTRHEIDIILKIKELLYRDGFTIAGAKKKLEIEPIEAVAPPEPPVATAPVEAAPTGAAAVRPDVARALKSVQKELRSILRMLEE